MTGVRVSGRASPPRHLGGGAGPRRGFTLVEVIVSLVLLAVIVLTLQGAAVRLLHQSGTDTRTTTALQLVEDRFALIEADPGYATLETKYNGSEPDVGGNAGLTRSTSIVQTRTRVGSKYVDYKRVTVTVSGSGLSAPISRTVTVGAP